MTTAANTQSGDSDKLSEEILERFFADREKVQKDPTYCAELKTIDMHLGRSDPSYPTTHQEVQDWFEKFHTEQAQKEKEKEEAAELARQLAVQEHIFSYPDGSVYMGHMSSDLKRHGRGTLRTPAFVYGEMKNYTSDEAAENAHLAKWHEYAGTWENDKMHGHGVNVQKSGDGGEILIFEGIWQNGKPTKAAAVVGDDHGNMLDDSVFGW
jgi:hypothetical protein